MKLTTRIKATFQEMLRMAVYWKERSEGKYAGDRFEEWVVKHSNIKGLHKRSCEPYWLLLDWRSDKYVEDGGYYPESSRAPDLLLEAMPRARGEQRRYAPGDLILVECKWRSTPNLTIKRSDIRKYEQYILESRLAKPISGLFYVFGFGWQGGSPKGVYVIPAQKLYTYDSDTGYVIYHGGDDEDGVKYFEDYKVTFQKGPFLIYSLEKLGKE